MSSLSRWNTLLGLTHLEGLGEAADHARRSYATSPSATQLALVNRLDALYRNYLHQNAPTLIAAARALITITPTRPCWECGAYDACPPNCLHGQAAAILEGISAPELPAEALERDL
jgi:hypothetical protein